MHTYIMNKLKKIKELLHDSSFTNELIVPIESEIEMMTFEVKQHISNMDNVNNIPESAQATVKNLEEIFELLEDIASTNDNEKNKIINEIIDLIDNTIY